MNKKIAILIITICLILLSISPINASSNGTDGIQAIDDGTDGIQAIDDAPVGEIIQDVDDESKVIDDGNYGIQAIDDESVVIDDGIQAIDDDPIVIEEPIDVISSGDEDYGTFSELSDLIQSKQGETVYLNKSYRFDSEYDVNFSLGIELNSALIEGNNHIIDGNGQSRIFKVVDENSAIISNLKLINGFSEKGGAVYCIGNLTLNNVTFENNNAKEGAAIALGKEYIEGGDDIVMIINNCSFKDSTNLETDLIYATNRQTLLKINNTVFKNISSKKSTVYCSDIYLSIENSLFEDLHSSSAGAAIRFFRLTNQAKSFNITNCSFINLSSLKNGGAVYNFGTNLTMIKTNFINCSSDYGGALVQLDHQLEIRDCNFTDNYAIYSGGAIYTSNIVKADISDSNFVNNKLNFTNDSILSNGGAIYADLNNIALDKVKFINNTRNAIYCFDCKSNISNCIFENNNEAIHLALSQLEKEEGNIYNNDSLVLNDSYYNMIMTGAGIELKLKNNTINVTVLPARFDSRDWGWVSPVKDQGESGACWAFSNCAALESALLKATGVEYSLSINNMQKIMLKYSKYGHNMAYEGGDATIGPQYALSWLGVYSEEYDPFGDAYGRITTPLISHDAIHIQDVIMLPQLENEEGRNDLKNLIMKCGAAFTMMYEDDYPLTPYFNNVTNAFYYFENYGGVSHAVTVVGWDDNYPASNFKRTPPGDGAWIVKNSYGTESYDNGYIYVSYYDTIFSKGYQLAYLIENTENYTKNYQTDLGGEIMFKAGADFAYKNNYVSIGKDLISAVGTYFYEKGQDYTIEIYVNNELKLTQKGKAPFMGFHTIKLNKEILINIGDNFTAVVKTSSVPLLNYSRTHHKANTSFINDGNGWIDLSELNFTASLKVYTKDLPAPKATKLSAASITNIYGNDKYFTVTLKDKDNKPISGVKVGININGIKYYTTDSKGQVRISVKSLVPKTYTAKISFAGNDFYLKSSLTSKVIVKKASVKLTAAKKTFKKSLKVKKYTVTLKNSKNKPMKKFKITLKIKKKTYRLKTNSKGKAIFKITNLKKKGTYKAIVKYAGNKYYKAKTVKAKIIVK